MWYRPHVQKSQRKTESVHDETDLGLAPSGTSCLQEKNGVDRSLIRLNLLRTPLECLQALEEMHQMSESAPRVDESIR